jgi:hypothetical protein
MQSKELAEKIGISNVNLSVLKTEKLKVCVSIHWKQSVKRWNVSQDILEYKEE